MNESTRKAIQKYQDKNIKKVNFSINRRTAADVVEIYEQAENKQGLLINALREYAANHPDKFKLSK